MENNYKYYVPIALILSSVSAKAEQLPLDVKQPYQIKSEQKEIAKVKKSKEENLECIIKPVMTDKDIELCTK